MMNVSIKGIGVVGGFGYGLTDLENALCHRPPTPQAITLETSNGPIEVPALLAETTHLEDFVPKRELRRTGHYIRMALLAAHAALKDAGFQTSDSGRTGIIVATGYGATCNTFDFQHSVINASDPCGSPTVFANSVHNAAASHLSISLKKMGPNLSLSHYDMSIPSAFATAVQWLEEDRVDTVLVGGVDEYCKVLGYYWHCRQQDEKNQPATETDVIGEGACFFVLSREEKPASPYGVLKTVRLGHGPALNVALPAEAVFFLGTDSYSECDPMYVDYLPPDAKVSIHSHIFGGVPIGIGFEVAIAALSHKTGKIFGSAAIDTRRVNGLSLIRPEIRSDQLLAESVPIGCLKLGAGKAYGWMILHPE